MQAVTEERLADINVEFYGGHAACVIMASNGYPASYEKGYEITIPEKTEPYVYVAGAKFADGKLFTDGGRVLGVTAKGNTLKEALDLAYRRVGTVQFENAFYRRDIGARALAAGKLED